MNFELVAIEKDLPPINLSKIEHIDLLRVNVDGHALNRMASFYVRGALAGGETAHLYDRIAKILFDLGATLLELSSSREAPALGAMAGTCQRVADLAVALGFPFEEACRCGGDLEELIKESRF